MNESSTGDDLIEFILQYRNVLDQMDEELGDDFPLWDVIERFDNEQKLQEELSAHAQRIGKAGSQGAGAKAAAEQPAAADTPAATSAEPAKPAGEATK